MKRREFIKTGMAGLAFISLKAMGCSGGSVGGEFDLTITEALFQMVDATSVYMLCYSSAVTGLRVPGPVLEVIEGTPIRISVRNTLSEAHGFAIPGVVDSGPRAPGRSAVVSFVAPAGGSYMYFDPVNAPVNRVLGLHGAMVVRPRAGNTPYTTPTPAVQQLFNDLGTTAHFPKHAKTPPGWMPKRFRIWLMNQVDPVFNEMAFRGLAIDPAQMKAEFLPQYFTMNGVSGAFSSHDESVVLRGRIGQPLLVRIMNAGLFFHSNHLHANHFFLTAINNVVQENVVVLDTFTIDPGFTIDWLVPYIRPPDIPGDPATPIRELIPNELDLLIGDEEESEPQSPLIYPMHCHNEPSQTARGGNYPQGVVTHFEFLGDIDGVDFPGAERKPDPTAP